MKTLFNLYPKAGRMRRPLTFGAVGIIGFVVDGGVMMLLTHLLGWTAMASRFLSFPLAVTISWWLNRRLTFSDTASSDRIGEWRRYLILNLGGFFINLAVFYACLLLFQPLRQQPISALATASLAAMFFNYCAAKHYAFVGNRLALQRDL